MATETLKTIAPLGITSAKAFVRGSGIPTDVLAPNGDTSSVSYGSVNVNLLTVIWTDLADGDYDCVLYYGSTAGPSDILRVSGASAVLLGDREYAELDPLVSADIAALQESVTAVGDEVDKIPRAGLSHRFTRIARNAIDKSADVSITDL